MKAAERIARQIVEDISGGTAVPGETLATEASMLKTYKVSRGTLREALRLLEIQGLVALKSGPSGGPVLAKPDPLFAGRMLTLFLRLSGATYEHVASALAVLDPIIARMAAERQDPTAARVLLAAVTAESCELSSRAGNQSRNPAEQLSDFHVVLGTLCGNPVLALLSNAIGSIFTRHIVAMADAAPLLVHSHEDHLRITESVVSGNGDEAWARAREHTLRLIEFHRTQVPGIFSQPVQWR